MKIGTFLLAFAVFLTISLHAQQTISGTIMSGGVSRAYLLYIPAIYNPTKAAPLVFNFHGYTSNNSQQIVYGEFRPIADTAGFLEVLPQGLVINGNTGFNNFGTVAAASADIEFVSNLIDSLKAIYNVNLNRVYSTGMSNGGFMSYDLACFLSTRFAAIASVSGSMVSAHLNACNPQHPVPVMEIHGDADPVVSYNGTGGILQSTDIDTLVKYWVNFDHCNSVPLTTNVPNNSTTDLCDAIHYVYNYGWSGSTVEFFKTTGGGHSWPGSPIPTTNGNTCEDFNASAEIWRFFNKYSLNSLTGVREEQTDNTILNLYPNPTSGMFTLEASDHLSGTFRILDLLGRPLQDGKFISGKNLIDLNSYPAGSYLLEYKNVNGWICKRIIKD